MPALDQINASLVPEPFRRAVLEAPLPSLGDGPSAPGLHNLLSQSPEPLAESDEINRVALAALWLVAGDLDRSHRISQDIAGREGSFWHGVMHRREGDFDNAKYWFRRVGDHPAFAALGQAVAADPLAAAVSGGGWDAIDFVDRCQSAVRRGGDEREACLRAQWIEWQVMFAHAITLDRATEIDPHQD